MLSLEQKLKILDNSRAQLEEAKNKIFDAGVAYDEVFPEQRTNHFFKEQHEIKNLIETIKSISNDLRIKGDS